MRKGLCIGTILRSDDTVASAGTLRSMLQIGQLSVAMGFDVDFIPLMGAGKDLARAQVLAAFHDQSKHDDLLWIDFGNAFPSFPDVSQLDVVAEYLSVLLTSEREALYCPYTTRGGRDLSFTASPPGDLPARDYVILEDGLRLMKLGGCGLGFVRMRRSVVERLYEKFGKFHGCSPLEARNGLELDPRWKADHAIDRGFLSDHSELGELRCIDVFSSRLGRRLHDFERPQSRPVRLLPEDDTFWTYCREIGCEPYALVDMPVDHGRTCPGINAPTFGVFAGIDVPGGEPWIPRPLVELAAS